jgi:hypothetical protein
VIGASTATFLLSCTNSVAQFLFSDFNPSMYVYYFTMELDKSNQNTWKMSKIALLDIMKTETTGVVKYYLIFLFFIPHSSETNDKYWEV